MKPSGAFTEIQNIPSALSPEQGNALKVPAALFPSKDEDIKVVRPPSLLFSSLPLNPSNALLTVPNDATIDRPKESTTT